MAEIAWMKVAGQDEYKQLARRLREASRGDLQRKLTKQIRRAGDPGLRAVQSAFLGIEVQSSAGGGGGSTGLRARVSAATRISVLGSGIRIRVDPKRVDPAYGRALTFGLNGLGRWRHPVFGNRNIWEIQTGTEVFYATLTRFENRWRAGVEKAMDETKQMIEG